MHDDDPYRAGAFGYGTCPRCASSIEVDGGESGRLVCNAGCGEWWSRESLVEIWAAVIRARVDPMGAWPWGPAPCARCRAPMMVAFREELRFDYCALHGVWLDTGEPERFFSLFVLPSR